MGTIPLKLLLQELRFGQLVPWGTDASCLAVYPLPRLSVGHEDLDKEANKAYWLPADSELQDTTHWIVAWC